MRLHRLTRPRTPGPGLVSDDIRTRLGESSPACSPASAEMRLSAAIRKLPRPWWCGLANVLLALVTVLLCAHAQDSVWDQETAAGRQALEARRYDDAEKHFQAALSIAEGTGASVPGVVTSLENLASAYQRAGEYAKIVPIRQRILALQEELLGPDSRELVPALSSLASAYRAVRNLAEAEPLMRRELAIQENEYGGQDPRVLRLREDLVHILRFQGKKTEAKTLLEEILSTRLSTPGSGTDDIARDLQVLSSFAMAEGQDEEALRLLTQALELREKEYGPYHKNLAWDLQLLAQYYSRLKRFSEAEPLLLRWLEIEEKNATNNTTSLVTCLNEVGKFYRSQRRDAQARDYFNRGLELQKRAEKALAEQAQDLQTAHEYLRQTQALSGQKHYAEAEQLYAKAFEIFERELGPEHPSLVSTLANPGYARCNQGKYDEADQAFERALQILEKTKDSGFTLHLFSVNPIALCYRKQGRFEEAEALYLDAIEFLDTPERRHDPSLWMLLGNYYNLLLEQHRFAEAQQIESRRKQILSDLTSKRP